MQVLIWKDKHGDALYDASTPENFQASALQILRDFIESQYIAEPDDPMKFIEYSGIDLELANLTDEQIEALPAQSMKTDAIKHKKRLAARKAEYEDELAAYRDVIKMLNGEKLYTAPYVYQDEARKGEVRQPREITPWMMLQGYTGGEYQEIELQSVWTPEEEA